MAKNLLYTGVTQGKRLVVLIAQKKAIGIAVRGQKAKRRWTKLKEWLSGIGSTKAVNLHAVETTGDSEPSRRVA